MLRSWVVAALASSIASAANAGIVEGQVELTIEGAELADLGPVVAFLSGGVEVDSPRARAMIRQTNAKFEPDFLVVSKGQEVEMPNMDTIFHNVFSFSPLNEFDLGLYLKGEKHSITMKNAGVVHIYCSIHESMSGVILISPTRYFARVDSRGRFSIPDVPAGDYKLTVWNERLPHVIRKIMVNANETVELDIAIQISEP